MLELLKATLSAATLSAATVQLWKRAPFLYY
jgi:hypothetical protein